MMMEDNDEAELLADYQAKKIVEFIPAMVFVAVFTTAGLIGNAFTFIYYGFKVKRTASTLFISSLALIDLVTCVLLFDHIIGLCYLVTFTSLIGCRIYTFVNYWFIYSSMFMLVVISIDRYRKLCKPFKSQFTLLSAKIAIAIAIICSLAIAIKGDFIVDIQHVDITNTNNQTFKGYFCLYTTEENMRNIVTSFYLIDIAVPMTMVIYFYLFTV